MHDAFDAIMHIFYDKKVASVAEGDREEDAVNEENHVMKEKEQMKEEVVEKKVEDVKSKCVEEEVKELQEIVKALQSKVGEGGREETSKGGKGWRKIWRWEKTETAAIEPAAIEPKPL